MTPIKKNVVTTVDRELSNIKLPTPYQEYIHLSRYSRWLPDKNRRETWPETVARYFDFFERHLEERVGYKLTPEERNELEQSVLELKVMPSMRCLMTAGEALRRDEASGYNCSFRVIDSPKAFDEILYVLTCGTGVGFSVEKKFVSKLPAVFDEFHDTDTTIVVADSRIGWAKALRELIAMLYIGQVPKWDVSKVRPKGTPLKTFGGRASGPEVLEDLFRFCIKVFRNAAGRKLTPLECHDIVCKIAEVIVVGGVRRSALISLSDLTDPEMRYAKSGQWWESNVQRALANNSAVYIEKPSVATFMEEWESLYLSKSGERGIFGRHAAQLQAEKNGRRETNHDFGVNPCAEVILRSAQMCNLTEVVVRAEDTEETLAQKIRVATILGTMQSTLTKFRYLSKQWETNCEEERLLGVSLTGVMDNKFMATPSQELNERLVRLREVAVETNKEWAEKFGIEQSTAITLNKPSGTVSQLVDSASGIHTRHNPYYIRTVRADNKDPLCQLMKDLGVPNEPDVTKPDHTTVFSFPVKAPDGSIYRYDRSAIEQLDLWLTYKKYWAEHTVSVTVSVKEYEWFDVAAWVYRNFDEISGVSFLPFSDHVYRQAPYQDCTEEEYLKLLEAMPKKLDWNLLSTYELTDHTTSTQTLACSGGVCEVVDLQSNS